MNGTDTRTTGLRQMLTTRRSALQAELEKRLRDGRADRSNEVREIVDLCDVGIEEELSFALLQMGHETLARVDAALSRLEAGNYGACVECGTEISEGRLRALPFAVRCMGCEVRHEREQVRSRQHGQRIDNLPLFPDLHGA